MTPSPDPDYLPVVTRLPEALQEEAEARYEAERIAELTRQEAEAAETDTERLQRESE
jgi:hypothetical protein